MVQTKFPKCRDCVYFHVNRSICFQCEDESEFEENIPEFEDEDVGGFVKNARRQRTLNED